MQGEPHRADETEEDEQGFVVASVTDVGPADEDGSDQDHADKETDDAQADETGHGTFLRIEFGGETPSFALGSVPTAARVE